MTNTPAEKVIGDNPAGAAAEAGATSEASDSKVPREGTWRGELPWLGVLLVIAAGLWLPHMGGPIDLRYDAGVYYTLGTSLAQGRGYRLLNEPGEIQAIQYPPLLPVIVAGHQWLLGTSDQEIVAPWLGVSMILFGLGVIAMTYCLARRHLPRVWSVLAGVIVAAHLWTCFLTDLCFAEIPFALVSLGMLLALSTRGSGAAGSWAPRQESVAAILAILAYLLRTAGLALLVAWVADALFHRRWLLALARTVIATIPVLAWQGYVHKVHTSADYAAPAYEYQRAPYQYYNVSYGENLSLIDPFAPERGTITPAIAARRALRHAIEVPVVLGEAVSVPRGFWWWIMERIARLAGPIPIDQLHRVPPLLVGCTVLAGLTFLLRRREFLLVIYVAGSIALMILTPWPQQFLRYTAPLAPLLAVALLIPMAWLATGSKRWGPVRRGAAIALGVGLLVSVLLSETYGLLKLHRAMFNPVAHRPDQRLYFYDPAWHEFDMALSWLAEQSERDAVVVTSAPHWTFLRTGLKAVQPPFEADVKRAKVLLDSIPAAGLWVIVDGFSYPGGDVSQRYSAPLVAKYPEHWSLAYTSDAGGLRVYRRAAPSSLPVPSE